MQHANLDLDLDRSRMAARLENETRHAEIVITHIQTVTLYIGFASDTVMASSIKDAQDVDNKNLLGRTQSHIPDLVEDTIVQDFGYEPAYRRVFSSLGSMSLTLAMASPMCGVFVAVNYQITYGGYWGLTWGWLVPALLFLPWALTTAEFCSAMPVNGANYWWTAALAPPSISRPISFIAGMANVMNALTSIASMAWASSSALCTIISLYNGWEPTNAVMFGIAWALCLLWFVMASMKMANASQLYIGSASIVLITSVVFFIALPVSQSVQAVPFAPASRVFGEYANFSDWNEPVAVPMTWFTAAWVITGWNAASAVAEETHNARIVAPRSIVTTYCLMSVMGFLVCVLLAFCIPDIEAAALDPSGFPALALLIERWGRNAGVAFLLVIFLNTAIGGGAVLVMMSCQTAAFARDGGLLCNAQLSRISPRSNMPVHTCVLLTGGGMLMLCLAFSPVASGTIYSLDVIAVMVLYALPMAFRILDAGEGGRRWVPGPWNYGRLSVPIHVVGLVTVLYMTVLECFPPEAHWTAATLNYNWAVLIGAVMLSAVMWFAHGTHSYKGPDQEMLAAWRSHQITQGVDTIIDGIRP
ncbi:hypothetical protein PG997_003395 [Apiospora hydei]|uniref:Amino acid transporter n=1 Tax=Apiospora hydei TaxID=1337664 RepID=A0ABR1WZ40_9PEZI